MSDKMDDERLEMNEKMMKMESQATEVENNLKQQVRLISLYYYFFFFMPYEKICFGFRK